MGVTWVFETANTVDQIERTLIAEGGKKVGNYAVEAIPYRPTEHVQGLINRLYLVHHSNIPQSSFLLAPKSGTRTEVLLQGSFRNTAKELSQDFPKAVGDRGFDLILARMTNGLIVDNNSKFKVTGQEIRLIDYFIRFGQATIGVSTKGVVVEVDYAPCYQSVECYNMLFEFCETLFPRDKVNRTPGPFQPEACTALDTAQQYLEVFTTMHQRPGPYRPPRPRPPPLQLEPTTDFVLPPQPQPGTSRSTQQSAEPSTSASTASRSSASTSFTSAPPSAEPSVSTVHTGESSTSAFRTVIPSTSASPALGPSSAPKPSGSSKDN